MTTTAGHVARKAEDSTAVEWGARAGIIARGVLWGVVGILALRLAFGIGGKADKQGALAALRDQPFGKGLLIALALAFAAHALFRLLEGTVGQRDEQDDKKRALKRALSLGRAVIYTGLAITTVKFLTSGGGGGGGDTKGFTARVMDLPAGRTIIGLVGVGLVVGGAIVAFKGVRQDFTEKLRMPGGRMRDVVKVLGTVGLAGRGLVYALIGSFLVEAAWTFDPNKAKGLDEALKSLADQSFGTIMLLIAATGMLAFGLWSFVEARYKKL